MDNSLNFNLRLYLDSSQSSAIKEMFTFVDDMDDDTFTAKFSAIYNQTKSSLSVVDEECWCQYVNECLSILTDYKSDDSVSDTEYFVSLISEFRRQQFNDRIIPVLIPYLSVGLFYLYPGSIFYPVLFNYRFNQFIDACKAIGIDMPNELPLQKDIDERWKLYATICESIEKFRKRYDLTKEDMCALIYGYAPSYLASVKTKESSELPSPTRIWFAGASKDDYNTSLKEDTSIWQCNPSTQRGDIVVVYALSPYSHIHSIWRAIRDASFNPFDKYCDRIEVGHRIEVPHVTNKELNEDAYTKEIPIVRKNLQGLNGVELTIEQYKYIQGMLKSKDDSFDISILPNIEGAELKIDNPILLEKDVEEHILIPVLKKLGYSEGDWERQAMVKFGRDLKGIPDFVFFRKKLSDSQQSAPFVIEAKLDFKGTKQTAKDFNQGVSYARNLRSTYMGICDKKKIIIYKCDDNGLFYDPESIKFQANWGMVMSNEETFNELKKLIGREVIAKMA